MGRVQLDSIDGSAQPRQASDAAHTGCYSRMPLYHCVARRCLFVLQV
jgi:hypothetical protein